MCARLFYLLLAAVFGYVTATVAAFVYLDWWQAILASAGTFVLLVSGVRLAVRRTVRVAAGRVEAAARTMFGADGAALRGAEVVVHAVRPVAGGYEFELTVFPPPAADRSPARWNVFDLVLEPADAAEVVEPRDLVLIEDGAAVVPVDGVVTGPRRLRFAAAVPRAVRELSLRYHLERLGQVRLSGPAALPPGPRGDRP